MSALRTSLQYPLRIDSVLAGDANAAGALIGMTFCPGKKQTTSLTGGWDRDLEMDVAALQAWPAAAVVTLMEQHEFSLFQVEGLGDCIERHGMRWYHMPFPDDDIPHAAFEMQWQQHAPELLQLLTTGSNIVIHCKGGLGRTGLVAARLLIALGTTPQDAIRQVRAARAGTIITPEQEQHVLNWRQPATVAA